MKFHQRPVMASGNSLERGYISRIWAVNVSRKCLYRALYRLLLSGYTDAPFRSRYVVFPNSLGDGHCYDV